MKFKKLLLLLFAVLTNTKVFADYSPYINGLNYIFDSENGTATVTYRYYSGGNYYSDRFGDVIIPETVTYNSKTYRVTCIGDHAFCNSSDLTSISVPSSIKRIGIGAFKNCTSLSKVIVKDIAAWCGIIYDGDNYDNGDFPLSQFPHLYSDEYTEIKNLVIPEGVTRIEPRAFRDAQFVTSITIPNSVTYIGQEAFRGMINLTSVNISQGITSIEPFVFCSCKALASINIPEGVRIIKENAFLDCSNLVSIKIPSTLTRVMARAFKDCNSLSKVIVSDIAAWCGIIYEGTDYNGDFPLGRATHLYRNEYTEITKVNIPEGVTRIEPLAFRDAKYVTSVTIPSSVTYIGAEAFRGMHRLTSINIPQGVTSIEQFTFSDCQALPNISIPDDITSIGNNAFSECFSLTSIALPHNLAIIGNYAFSNCRSLLSIHIPKHVSTIGENTFAGCSSLSEVTLNDNLTQIGQRAFQNTNLKSLVIPNSVQEIGPWAFENYNNNPSLESLVLGESLVSILSGAFLSQTNLKKVTCLASNPPTIQDQYIFSVYDTLYVPSGREVAYEAANYWKKFKHIKGLTNTIDAKTNLYSNKWSGARYTVQAISYSGGMYGDPETEGNVNYNKIVNVPNADAYGRKWFEPNYTCNWRELTAPLNNWCSNYGDIYARRSFYYEGELPTELYLACGHDDAPCEYYLNGELIWSVTDGWFEQEIYKLTPDQVALLKPGEQNVLAFHVHQNWGGMYADCGLYTSLSNIGISNNCGDNLTWSFDEETGTLTISGTGEMYDNTLWPGFHSQIKHVEIQSGVTSIGKRAFDNCQSLVSINIPGSVNTIGEYAFYNCAGLTSIDIPSRVKSISDFAFEGCRGLTSINIPYGVGDIDISSFGRCSSLTSITIPISITSIGDYAFEYDSHLSDVYCYAEDVPQAKSSSFNGSNIASATLHVPSGSVEKYRSTSPWSGFGDIKPLTYNLTYIVDGEAYKTAIVVYGSEIIPEVEPTKEGYTFGGWNGLPETMPAQDVEVTGWFYLYGDVNTDEKVNVVDVVDIARFVVATPSEKFREKLADLNTDNNVNIGDAVTLVNHIAGDQNFVKAWAASENVATNDALTLTEGNGSLSLNLENGRSYTAFQFDLYVPENSEVSQMLLNAERRQGHQLLYNMVEEGHYRVAALSISNNEFYGSNGELLNITMNGASGDEVSVRNIRFFDAQGNGYLLEDVDGASPTSIRQIDNGELIIDNSIYDLQGRKREKVQRGVNIVGGKKMIVK